MKRYLLYLVLCVLMLGTLQGCYIGPYPPYEPPHHQHHYWDRY